MKMLTDRMKSCVVSRLPLGDYTIEHTRRYSHNTESRHFGHKTPVVFVIYVTGNFYLSQVRVCDRRTGIISNMSVLFTYQRRGRRKGGEWISVKVMSEVRPLTLSSGCSLHSEMNERGEHSESLVISL